MENCGEQIKASDESIRDAGSAIHYVLETYADIELLAYILGGSLVLVAIVGAVITASYAPLLAFMSGLAGLIPAIGARRDLRAMRAMMERNRGKPQSPP